MAGALKVLLILGVVLSGFAFHLRNGQLVAIDYYIGSHELALSLVVVISLFIGALLGVISSLPIIIKLKRANTRLNKQMKKNKKELNHLPLTPLKNPH